jgi:hypothetical protein
VSVVVCCVDVCVESAGVQLQGMKADREVYGGQKRRSKDRTDRHMSSNMKGCFTCSNIQSAHQGVK